MIQLFLENKPHLGEGIYIDPTALIIGAVTLGDDSSVWPFVSIRGDVNTISIGARSNIQDGSVLHVTHKNETLPDGYSLVIGSDVTIGHRAILHGCTLGDRILIGMGATILDGALIENDVLLAAGSLVSSGKILESGFLYMGSPARKVRELSVQELLLLQQSAANYLKLKDIYLRQSELPSI